MTDPVTARGARRACPTEQELAALPASFVAGGHSDLGSRSRLEDALATIERFTPSCEAQQAAKDRILSFVRDHPDALHRTCEPGHLTASALVLDASGEAALVMLHRKLNIWVQMGGHADGEANLARAALREATEESGIDGLAILPRPLDLDVHEVRPPGEPAHLHLDVRHLVMAPAGATARPNRESKALRWVTQDELSRLGDAGLRRLAHHAFALARR